MGTFLFNTVAGPRLKTLRDPFQPSISPRTRVTNHSLKDNEPSFFVFLATPTACRRPSSVFLLTHRFEHNFCIGSRISMFFSSFRRGEVDLHHHTHCSNYILQKNSMSKDKTFHVQTRVLPKRGSRASESNQKLGRAIPSGYKCVLGCRCPRFHSGMLATSSSSVSL